MKNLKQRQAKVLQETLEYYQQDPEARRCKKDGNCKYDPKTLGKQDTSEGCAVGRLLTPELKQELDQSYNGMGVSNSIVFDALPPEVQELTQDFLASLQNLHDGDYYWNAEGLTEAGEREYKMMMKRVEEGYYEE